MAASNVPNFEIGSRYNFNTVSPTVLSASYKNMKVIAILTFRIAIKYADVVTINEQIEKVEGISLLDPKDVRYILFENEYGEEVVLAEDWIDPNSVVKVDSITATIRIENITTEDLLVIENALRALGYNKIDITTTSTTTT